MDRTPVETATGTGSAAETAEPPVLIEGETCWRLARADRVAVLIDGDAYFRALHEAFRAARRRIMVLGWDFDGRMRLDPQNPDTELRYLLPGLVQARPDLEVRVLVWDVAPLFGPSRTIAPLVDRDWQDHPRIHVRYDARHPPGASHHAKIVCIDDALAFAGGIDLTVNRWDTREHLAIDPRRVAPDGEQCEPVHDIQLLVDGAAAATLSTHARERWAQSEGEALDVCVAGVPAWPASAPVWVHDVAVGIARTRPKLDGDEAIDEVARLNDAAFDAARRSLYIEAQYLCAGRVADRLVALLGRPDPPDVVIVVWQECFGWLERLAMAGNRDRILRRLAAADHAGRLRVYRLAAKGDLEREIKLHAKLIIVDDRFVRIGSSNLNNRSLGVDTECDLAIEGHDAATRGAIEHLQATLLAEHLGCSAASAQRALGERGLIGAVDHLNGGRLQPYVIDPEGETGRVAGSSLIDPEEPLDRNFLARVIRYHLPAL